MRFHPEVGTDLGELIRETRIRARQMRQDSVRVLCDEALDATLDRRSRAFAWYKACVEMQAQMGRLAEEAWEMYAEERHAP